MTDLQFNLIHDLVGAVAIILAMALSLRMVKRVTAKIRHIEFEGDR